MGCCSAKNVAAPGNTLLQEAPSCPVKAAAADVRYRIVRMPIQPGTLEKMLAVLTKPDTQEMLKKITGLEDAEIIAISDTLVYAQTRYTNARSMQEAEAKVNEVLKPLSEFHAGVPEESLAIGGSVVLSGNRVWTLSANAKGDDDVLYRTLRIPILPGTLENILAVLNKPDTQEMMKNIAGLQDAEISVVSDTVIDMQIRYSNAVSMQQAATKVYEIMMPLSEFYAGDQEESVAIGGTGALSGNRMWMLSTASQGAAYAMKTVTAAQDQTEKALNEITAYGQEYVPEVISEETAMKAKWMCCS